MVDNTAVLHFSLCVLLWSISYSLAGARRRICTFLRRVIYTEIQLQCLTTHGFIAWDCGVDKTLMLSRNNLSILNNKLSKLNFNHGLAETRCLLFDKMYKQTISFLQSQLSFSSIQIMAKHGITANEDSLTFTENSN